MSLYLEGALPWLLDPESAELLALAKEANARTPDTPCGDLDADAELFRQVLRERHFSIATGRVAMPDVTLPHAKTWGDLAELQSELRMTLGDEHMRFLGARTPSGAIEGPAVEKSVIDGVLVLRVRRLFGTPDDERELSAWVASADDDFAHARVIVDLRGNAGGNDGHTYEWMERRMRAVSGFCSSSTWTVSGRPLGLWNTAVWRYALYGMELPERLSGDLAVVDETYDLPAGDLPWDGRMLVLVDRHSRSSGESSGWLLREGLRARLLGEPTHGMIEYGNITSYPLPGSGLVVQLPTKSNDYGFRVEGVGFPVDEPLDPETPVAEVARRFDSFV